MFRREKERKLLEHPLETHVTMLFANIYKLSLLVQLIKTQLYQSSKKLVNEEYIIATLPQTTWTSAIMKCQEISECNAIGCSSERDPGQRVDCHLISKPTCAYKQKDGSMYVIDVSFVGIIDLVLIQV